MRDRRFFELSALFDHSLYLHSSQAHFDHVAADYLNQVAATPHMCAALDWQITALEELFRSRLKHMRNERIIRIADFGAGAGAVSSWPALQALLRVTGISSGPTPAIELTLLDASEQMKWVTRELSIDACPESLIKRFANDFSRILDLVRQARYRDHDIASEDAQLTRRLRAPQHIIICSFVMHHLSLQGKLSALRLLRSALRDDGFLILVDEYRTHDDHLRYLDELVRVRRRTAKEIPYGLESFVDHSWYIEAFRESGIELRVLTAMPQTGATLGYIIARHHA
ncbi:MAG: hypothetical protein ACF8PN_09600 [Phycisphaerales bacterium]